MSGRTASEAAARVPDGVPVRAAGVLRAPGLARGAWTIAVREFSSMFRLPVGWVVVALFAFLSGALFVALVLRPGGVATLAPVFGFAAWILMPLAPAISMRAMADEVRLGTIEPLMTSPVSDASIVLGKFGGASLYLLAMLSPLAVLMGVLAWIARPAPDPGPIVAGLCSVVLLGMLYVALGVLASALTSNQTLAYIGTLLTILLMLIATETVANLDGTPAWASTALASMSIPSRMRDFASGVLDLGHASFFLLATAALLALTTLCVGARRVL